MPFKKNLLKAQKLSLQMRDGPFPEVKKDMVRLLPLYTYCLH